MKHVIEKVGALAMGALAMYYLDPQLGAQRRALLGELLKGGWQSQKAERATRRMARRAYHRTPKADPQRDAELRDEIREALGRWVAHPRAIDVQVEDGVVRLSGDVLSKEREGLLLQVLRLPGVQKLVNAMTAHDTPQGIATLEARETSADQAVAA
jgi:osmotically-inducible protein OsmY